MQTEMNCLYRFHFFPDIISDTSAVSQKFYINLKLLKRFLKTFRRQDPYKNL